MSKLIDELQDPNDIVVPHFRSFDGFTHPDTIKIRDDVLAHGVKEPICCVVRHGKLHLVD